MKENELFEIIGDIEDNKIASAYNAGKGKKRFFVLKGASLAACFVLIAAVSFSIVSEKTAENIPEEKNVSVIIKNKTEDLLSEKGEEKETADSLPDGGVSADTEEEEKVSVTRAEGVQSESAKTADSEITEDAAADASPGYSSGGGGGSSANAKNSEVSAFFGGSYIDKNGNFVVVLTEDNEKNREAVCRYLGRKEENTTFKKGEFTLSYLTELQRKISEKMADKELPFVVSSAVMETINKIEVSVTITDENELEKVKALDTKGGAIEFRTGSPYAGLQ